ncbi:MAG: TspO/MBR family protein [archaeon]|jgi:tryptophan-rich sensory protein|nr:tryptophan-rich sensory protein [archaeon]MDD2477411.1 tryptophan-rich sensory protein [Candidatus ainarchaeum sp.]MDD3084476.1 tryptophan-rich sensory protein [Candidatus ainarchaeum sp.]MDD4220942.1 tryptophan-rich sensory protein [Candidatus ainarchaeum sp.]MDD4662256.1 tryptophan-rich sensory protein [Candidatus ainarchaeum sp.]
MKKNLKYFIISLISVIITAFLGSIFTSRNIPFWYKTINLPSLVPPNFVFPIVWNILFILMIISFYLILINKSKKNTDFRKIAIWLFSIQLIFNILWSLLFFELNLLLLVCIEIIILEILILFSIIYFYKINKLAAYLLIPYFLWVLFATFLTISVFILN